MKKPHPKSLPEGEGLILNLTGFTELEYNWMQYEQGLEWLKLNDANWVFEGCKLFWNWWKNQWSIRDNAFVKKIAPLNLTTKELKMIYQHKNNASILMGMDEPILHKSYSHFVDVVRREVTSV